MAYIDNSFQIAQFLVIDTSVSKDEIFSRNGSGEYNMSGLCVFIPTQKYPVIYNNKCIAMAEIEDCQMSAHNNKIFTAVFYRYVEISPEDANAFTHLWMMNAPAEQKQSFATPGSMGFNTKKSAPMTKTNDSESRAPWSKSRNENRGKSKHSPYRFTKDTGRFEDL